MNHTLISKMNKAKEIKALETFAANQEEIKMLVSQYAKVLGYATSLDECTFRGAEKYVTVKADPISRTFRLQIIDIYTKQPKPYCWGMPWDEDTDAHELKEYIRELIINTPHDRQSN